MLPNVITSAAIHRGIPFDVSYVLRKCATNSSLDRRVSSSMKSSVLVKRAMSMGEAKFDALRYANGPYCDANLLTSFVRVAISTRSIPSRTTLLRRRSKR